MLLKLSAVKKCAALKLKKTTMNARPMTIGRTPRLPVLMLSSARPTRLLAGGGRSVLSDDLDWRLCHGAAPAAAGTPGTFVGTPAVIASTTTCWVVFSRS